MNPAYGGKIVKFSPFSFSTFRASPEFSKCAIHKLSDRQSCDLEMLQMGAFSPLAGFMIERDYQEVVKKQRLANGMIFPLPVVLDISAEFAEKLKGKDFLLL